MLVGGGGGGESGARRCSSDGQSTQESVLTDGEDREEQGRKTTGRPAFSLRRRNEMADATVVPPEHLPQLINYWLGQTDQQTTGRSGCGTQTRRERRGRGRGGRQRQEPGGEGAAGRNGQL